MKHEGIKQLLCEQGGHKDALVFENPSYDDAFIGISDTGRAIYDYDLMVECLVAEDGMSAEEAIEFIDFNTIRSLPYFGDMAPIVLYRTYDDI